MKLKKKMITKQLQRIRLPGRIPLSDFTSFYTKLIKKYGKKSSLRVGYFDGYYSGNASGYWLYERRLETDTELAKRQAAHDRELARKKAETLRYRRIRKAEALKRKKAEAAAKQALMEKKVEEVKTMVSLLKAAGYNVSAKQVVSKARS